MRRLTAIEVAAFAVPLCVLPSAAWRLGMVATTILGGDVPCVPGGTVERLYICSLSVASMAAALLTIGLVRRSGEVVPSRIPLIGGRTVPVRAATSAALAGATLIALLTVWGVYNGVTDAAPTKKLPPGCEPPGLEVGVLYLPLLAWAPLLFVVTRHYYRRRTMPAAAHGS
jgi:hypothetical protein